VKKVFSNTLVQVLGKIVTVMVALVTTGFLTRRLGTVVYGDFLLIQSLVLVIYGVADMGTGVIGVRELSRKLKEKTFSNLLILRKLLALGALVVMTVGVMSWSPLLELKREIFVAGLMIIAMSLLGDLGILFHTHLRLDLKTILDIGPGILFLVLLVMWRGELNLGLVILGYLAVRVLVVIGGMVIGDRISRVSFSLRSIDKESLKKLLKISWPMGVYLLIFTSYDRMVDSFMIRHFLGRDNLAWYGLAYKIYGNLIMPAYFLVNSMFPLLSKNNGEGKGLAKKGLAILMGLVVLGWPLVWIGAPVAINLLGGTNFGPGITALRWLSLGLGFSYINHLLGFVIVAKDGQKKILGYGIAAALFNLVANFFIIPAFGINGAAAVTVMTEGLMMIMAGMFFFRRVGKERI